MRIGRGDEVLHRLPEVIIGYDDVIMHGRIELCTYEDRIEIGTGEIEFILLEELHDINLLDLELQFPNEGLEQVLLFRDVFGVKQREMFLRPPLPLEINGKQVRPAGYEEPDELPAIFRVPHE